MLGCISLKFLKNQIAPFKLSGFKCIEVNKFIGICKVNWLCGIIEYANEGIERNL